MKASRARSSPRRPFVDTNVLIYAFSAGDPRAEIAESILADGPVIGVQTLNEFAAVASRKLGMSWRQVREATAAIRALCPDPPVAVTLAIHERALAIAEKQGYAIYDSLMLAAAESAGCRWIYSEDMRSGLKLPSGLEIRNPFR